MPLVLVRFMAWTEETCFDLLLRAGALGVGGERYGPEIAYLDGSTGPKAGFNDVWGRPSTGATAPWAEGVLRAWHEKLECRGPPGGGALVRRPVRPR